MNQEEIKTRIRTWAKSGGRISSDLGEIEIGQQIAEGGTAIVFASNFAGGTAIKFLAESISDSQSDRYKRFLGEYVNLIRLVSTGVVVPLYHYGVQDIEDGLQVPYIVMERCTETLHDRYKGSRLQDPIEFNELLERLLTVLETLHDAGIIHRDIKPKNILLRPSGDWALADFGIAWFDPEFYAKLAETEKGDRLANWGFSAPEQFRRDAYEEATPCLDLYALGQTLYYCVSGTWIAGSGYPRFAQIAPSLSSYDPLIAKLVRQEPSERFQSVDEVREFLREQADETEFQRDARRVREMERQVKAFDLRLKRAVPGSYNYYQAKGKAEIDRVLASLAEDCEKYDLQWIKGRSCHNACPIRPISEESWLIESFECRVADLWVYRNSILERQFVVLHLAPQPTFGFSDPEGADYDGAGYFDGRYVPPQTVEDGYAEIDGTIVEIPGARYHERNLKVDFLILAPELSVCNARENEDKVEEVYHSLIEAGRISRTLLQPLGELPRTHWMLMLE